MNISSWELVFRRHSIVKTLHSNESKIINSINVKDVQSVEYKTLYITHNDNRIKKKFKTYKCKRHAKCRV